MDRSRKEWRYFGVTFASALKFLRLEETRYSHPYPAAVPFSLNRLSISAYSSQRSTAFFSDTRRQLYDLLASSSFDTLTHLDLQDVEDAEAFSFCLSFAFSTNLTHLVLPTYPPKFVLPLVFDPWDQIVGTFLSKAIQLTHLSVGDVTATTFGHIGSTLPSTLRVLTVRQYAGLRLSLLVETLREGYIFLEELRLPKGSLAGGKAARVGWRGQRILVCVLLKLCLGLEDAWREQNGKRRLRKALGPVPEMRCFAPSLW